MNAARGEVDTEATTQCQTSDMVRGALTEMGELDWYEPIRSE